MQDFFIFFFLVRRRRFPHGVIYSVIVFKEDAPLRCTYFFPIRALNDWCSIAFVQRVAIKVLSGTLTAPRGYFAPLAGILTLTLIPAREFRSPSVFL